MDSLTATIKAAIVSTAGKNRDFVNLSLPINYAKSLPFTFGTAANQINDEFDDYRTLTASSTENLDLAGTLTNGFGETLSLARVKIFYLENTSETETITIGGAASDPFIGWFADATDKETVPPLGFVLRVAPGTTAWPVTAATGDLLKIANSGGASTTYRVYIAGATA